MTATAATQYKLEALTVPSLVPPKHKESQTLLCRRRYSTLIHYSNSQRGMELLPASAMGVPSTK